MNHIAYVWVMAHTYESRCIHMSHVKHERIMSHMHETCHIQICVTHKGVFLRRFISIQRCHIHGVLLHRFTSCHILMCLSSFNHKHTKMSYTNVFSSSIRKMSHTNVSFFIDSQDVTYKCVLSLFIHKHTKCVTYKGVFLRRFTSVCCTRQQILHQINNTKINNTKRHIQICCIRVEVFFYLYAGNCACDALYFRI